MKDMPQEHTKAGSRRAGLCRGLWRPWFGLLRVISVEAGDPLSVLRHNLLGRAHALSGSLLRLLSRALGGARCALRCHARCACCAFQALFCPLCSLLSPLLQRLCCLQCLLSQRWSLQQAEWSISFSPSSQHIAPEKRNRKHCPVCWPCHQSVQIHAIPNQQLGLSGCIFIN